jgi:hypothetical protein
MGIDGARKGWRVALVALLAVSIGGAPAGAEVRSAPGATLAPSVPGPVPSVRAFVRHEGAVVRWAEPKRRGASRILEYQAKASPGGRTCSRRTKLHCRIVGLTDGRPYSVAVRARNRHGWGGWSAPVPPIVPRYVVADVPERMSPARMETFLGQLVGERRTDAQRAAARTLLRTELEGAGYTVVDDEFADGGVNVVARLEGTDPTAGTVVVGAHYDTVAGSPGADDNASGVVATVEIARTIAPMQPRASIEFVLFDLEEVGLRGSRHYVDDGVVQGPVIGAVIMDMIGYTCDEPGCQVPIPDLPGCLEVDPDGVDVGVGIAAAGDEQSWDLLDLFAATADRRVPRLEYGTGKLAGTGTCLPLARRSDHVPFWDNGMPAIILSNTAELRNPHYHQATDTLDTVDVVFMSRVARAAGATVARLAGVGTT